MATSRSGRARTPDLKEVGSKAIELGVYLPLGAYSRVRDRLSDVDVTNLNIDRAIRLYGDLVARGRDRVKPVAARVSPQVRKVERSIDRTRGTARKTAKKTSRRAEAAVDALAPKLPRVAAPKKASELPITGYASLTAGEIVTAARGLTQTDLARVYKYERAHENRATIIDSIETKFVELPIPTYDDLTVDEIADRLPALSGSQLKTLRRYEDDTKARVTIIDKIDSLI